MHYLHTMVRVNNLEQSLDFYCNKLGLVEVRRMDSEAGRFTLVYLSAPDDLQQAQANDAPLLELTYNWDTEDYTGGRNFGHLAFAVDDIYSVCQRLLDQGVTINRPPRDGWMAFIRSPDQISIELLQKGQPLPIQEPWASMPSGCLVSQSLLLPLSLYIHFPWCIQKCPYCDFNSHAVKAGIPEQAYIDALLADLRVDLALVTPARPIQSIFMGGGTPSLFSPEAIERLLLGIQEQVLLTPDCEITLEANPGTFESDKFKAFRQLGINRLSIGIQSFNDPHLKKLGRVHSAAEALKAVAIAQQAGFDNLNLDLMFGLPEQTSEQALFDVQTAIDLNPSHISFYQLTLEPNTYFHRFPPKLPEDDTIYAIQKNCQQRLAAHGYQQYEISAYAQQGKQARHNLNYWQFGDYLGIGAGAHGKISQALPEKIIRTIKPKSPEQYLKQAKAKQQTIAIEQLPLEFVMNHLRLKTGFNLADYVAVTGLGVESLEPALTQCLQQGLLVKNQQQISCSEKGWDFLDVVLEKFIVL